MSHNKSYWVATGLVALGFYASGLLDLAQAAPVLDALHRLGYPDYVAKILGAWKLLAVLAILAPEFPRLKEWTYAGIFFDLSGAILSHLFSNEPAAAIAPAVFLTLSMTSWALRPESRRLPDADERHPVASNGESAPHIALTIG